MEVRVIQHTFKVRGHWWFDSGLMGLYFIAKNKTTLEAERWPDVKVVLDFDGVSVEAYIDEFYKTHPSNQYPSKKEIKSLGFQCDVYKARYLQIAKSYSEDRKTHV